MHPALGLGEDWNTDSEKVDFVTRLHPALGLGEDWNSIATLRRWFAKYKQLHPALGLGEDWNSKLLAFNWR